MNDYLSIYVNLMLSTQKYTFWCITQIDDEGESNVRSWTIRYEAKLNFFKGVSHVIGNNFKNISYKL